MKRNIVLSFGITAFLLLLSGCGINVLNSHGVMFGVDPAPLGYEVSDDGIEIPSHLIKMHSRRGAMGATVRGYNVYYFNQAGEPIYLDDHVVYSKDSLNVYVPPGIRCDDPDEDVGCTIHSSGAHYTEGYQVVSQPTLLLAGSIALEMERVAREDGHYNYECDPDHEDYNPEEPDACNPRDDDAVLFSEFVPKYPVGWYAEIELFGIDDAGREFVTQRLTVDINVPLGD